jgi:hypothetical protein
MAEAHRLFAELEGACAGCQKTVERAWEVCCWLVEQLKIARDRPRLNEMPVLGEVGLCQSSCTIGSCGDGMSSAGARDDPGHTQAVLEARIAALEEELAVSQAAAGDRTAALSASAEAQIREVEGRNSRLQVVLADSCIAIGDAAEFLPTLATALGNAAAEVRAGKDF